MLQIMFPAIMITILCVSVVLNTIGIYLLRKIKNSRTYQNVILINLSTAQILMSLLAILYWVLAIYGYDMRSGITLTLLEIITSFYFPLYTLVTFLTIDRFLACKLSLRYKVILTERRTFVVLAMAWLFGLTHMFVFLFSDNSVQLINMLKRWMLPILDGIFICAALITYAFILSKILGRVHAIEMNEPATNRMEAFRLKFFQVAGIIVLTFVILVIGPHIVETFYSHTKGEIPIAVELVTQTVLSLYFIILPLLYIFMQKEVRVLFLQSLRSSFKCIHQTRNRNEEKPESNAVYDTWL